MPKFIDAIIGLRESKHQRWLYSNRQSQRVRADTSSCDKKPESGETVTRRWSWALIGLALWPFTSRFLAQHR